jgi:hypothetical protein
MYNVHIEFWQSNLLPSTLSIIQLEGSRKKGQIHQIQDTGLILEGIQVLRETGPKGTVSVALLVNRLEQLSLVCLAYSIFSRIQYSAPYLRIQYPFETI